MKNKKEYQDIEVQTGIFMYPDGTGSCPKITIFTAEEQREAAEHGLTLDDLIDIELHAQQYPF